MTRRGASNLQAVGVAVACLLLFGIFKFYWSYQVSSFVLAVYPGLSRAEVIARVGPPRLLLLPGQEDRLGPQSGYYPESPYKIEQEALVYRRVVYRFVVYLNAQGRVAHVITQMT